MAEVRWTRFKWEINKVTEGEVVSSSVHANDSLRYHACVVIRRRLQTTAKPLVNRRSIVIFNVDVRPLLATLRLGSRS